MGTFFPYLWYHSLPLVSLIEYRPFLGEGVRLTGVQLFPLSHRLF
jgi:hypothetical protein